MRKLRLFASGMIGAAIGLLFYCGSFYVQSCLENQKAQAAYKNLRDTYFTDEKMGEKKSKFQERKDNTVQIEENVKKDTVIEESFGIQWKKLKEINKDIVAWIEIPNADISYPIVQAEDNEYYLKHSFEKKEDLFGCIFLDAKNKNNFKDSHSFLYGHNMEGNMMFANLNKYENVEFLEECPNFYIFTPEYKILYRIFSIEQAEEGGKSFRYGLKRNSREYSQLLNWMKEHSMYTTGIIPSPSMPVVSLVTCNSQLDETIRMVVHGILENTWSFCDEKIEE